MWIYAELLGFNLRPNRLVPLRVLRDLRGLSLRLLRGDFVEDSRDRFLGFFPATKSTEAKISFTGGAKA